MQGKRRRALVVTSGYSGTPLVKKLGILPDARLFLHAPPENYRQLLGPLPESVTTVPRIDTRTDLAHLFATRRAALGLVDIKVCAVDATWSGLKMMLRRRERAVPAARPRAARRRQPSPG